MLVYRCASISEIATLMGIPNAIAYPRGINTFIYAWNTEYKHFFYHLDSAIFHMDAMNLERYHDTYSLMLAYDIDDNILKEHFGFGKYNTHLIPNAKKDTLLKYFNYIYLPEFAIPADLIKKEMIVAIGSRNVLKPVYNISYDRLDESIRTGEVNFLEYEKWLFNHGTDVNIETIEKEAERLFPICDSYNKKL